LPDSYIFGCTRVYLEINSISWYISRKIASQNFMLRVCVYRYIYHIVGRSVCCVLYLLLTAPIMRQRCTVWGICGFEWNSCNLKWNKNI